MLILLISLALAETPPDAVLATTSPVPPVETPPAHHFDAVAVPEPFDQMDALRAILADNAQSVGECLVGFDGLFLNGTLKIDSGSSAGVGDVTRLADHSLGDGRSDNAAVDAYTLDCLNAAFRDVSFPYTPEVTPVHFLFR